MLYPTTPGMIYAVEADGAIEIINASGIPVYTGENALVFPAVGTAYTITPDTADVKQLFKLAPRTKLHLLMGGAGGWLPAGFTALEYLESSGTQYIAVGTWNSVDLVTEAEFFLPESSVDGNTRAVFSGSKDFGTYYYYWTPSLYQYRATTQQPCIFANLDYNFNIPSAAGRVNNIILRSDEFELNGDVIKYPGEVVEFDAEVYIFAAQVAGRSYYLSSGAKIYKITFTQSDKKLDLRPVLDASGTPCMFDKISRKCYYNSGTGSFIAGLTMKQLPALRRLRAVTSGELTLSLPWEAQLVKHGAPAILESVKNRGWTLIVQYAEPDTESAVYNKYAACKTVADIAAVNPDYRNDLTIEKEWVYPLSNLERTGLGFQDHNSFFYYAEASKVNFYAPKTKDLYYLFYAARIRKVHIYAPNATNGAAGFRWCSLLEEVTGDLSSLQDGHSLLGRCYKIRSWSIPTPQLTNGTEMFFVNSMLEDVQTEFPALSKGTKMFYECILNKESVIRVANSLPTWTSGTHEICFGIHVDNQNDEEVLAALEAVEAKGWTLTVQWNGTATAAAASTYGLRRPPVYAKLAEPREEEEQMLDWGHYVTNWEENGYTEFTSLEEAYAHFNLTQE